MPITRFFTTPVTIIEPGSSSDGYSGTAPDWQHPASQRHVNGWLTQVSTTEEIGGRDVTVTYDELTLPAGDPITSAARVQYATDLFEVDGRPQRSRTPGQSDHHVIVRLRLATEVTV